MSKMIMFKGYREARRCKRCKKVYYPSAPDICCKCGTKLYNNYAIGPHRTDDCEVVIAKKTLFGWKVKEGDEE